ncbi:MAG: ABC transporter substrate-binding protein [Saccharofermentans sp.]|nr:ABC transporter substrate-binding protein [Saccharofermentans sp.]
MKKAMSVILAAALVMSIAACSKDDETADESVETTVAEETAEETEAEETEVVETTAEETEATVVDVDSDIRVVSLSPEVTEIIFALGAEDKLVGVSTYDDYPEEVFNYPVVGDLYALDVEAIAAVEPTVVLVSDFVDEDTIAAFNEYGIDCVMVSEGTSIDGMLDLIAEVASYVDAEDVAEDLIADVQADLDAIEAVDTDATVYYVVSYGEYGDWSAGGGSFIDGIITASGAKNAAGDLDQWAMLDPETLIDMDPDFIVISTWTYDDFISLEPYSALTAVQEGRVIAVDENIFVRQTPRNVEAVQILVDAIAEYEAA